MPTFNFTRTIVEFLRVKAPTKQEAIEELSLREKLRAKFVRDWNGRITDDETGEVIDESL